MNDKVLELKEKCKNGDFDDNELIDLVLHLDRKNQMLVEENIKLEQENKQLREQSDLSKSIIDELEKYLYQEIDNQFSKYFENDEYIRVVNKIRELKG